MREYTETTAPSPRPSRAGNINIENRERITVSGVTDVDSFNELEIMVRTDNGRLTVFGQGLHISRLDLEQGHLSVDGLIGGVEYTDVLEKQSSPGLFNKLFR